MPQPHATEVDGYEGALQDLAQKILSMRYDRVQEFFAHCASEFNRQAEGDRGRNRPRLASLLDGAAEAALILEGQMKEIFDLCAPYMKDELQ